jgi:hypothetical protein
MSFDKDDGHPIVNVHRRTSKVNIWMAVVVVIFIVGGIIAAYITLR